MGLFYCPDKYERIVDWKVDEIYEVSITWIDEYTVDICTDVKSFRYKIIDIKLEELHNAT